MKNRVTNYKGYVITSEEGIEKGIFFRNPLQKVDFDAYGDEPILSAWKYLDRIKNPIRRMYEILIGNGKIIQNIEEWSKDIDWGGFTGNILCPPIYFKRNYRKLKAVSNDSNNNIQEINSYGYESEFNICAGDCVIERTVIKTKSGKRIKLKQYDQYNFTYEHIIKGVIDTNN